VGVIMTSTILPSDLGLPDKFQTWRPGQWASIETTLETDKRFIAASTPTGGGKSVYAVASAILEAKRAIYLTSTKGLQSQLSNDFAACGMIDMRGRQNYQCVKGNISCADGRILECRDFGCPYNASRKEFLDATLASTNYAYYFSSIMHSEGVGDAGMLILDEAHAAVQELCNAIEIRLDHNKASHIYRELGSSPPYGDKISAWRTWAKFLLPKAQKYLKDMKSAGPNKWLALTDQFVLTIGQISGVSEDWILDESNDSETLISPLWPTAYSHTYLFRDIPRIILASATLVPKTLSLLGIEEKDSVFLSQDHTFSPDRCPLYIFGACRVDYKMSEGQWQETVGRMDTLIDKRLDRKGIIHTTSYAYQEKITRDSEHRDIMIAPRNSRETHAAIEEFRHSTAPRILVSPAITTGYDFPYDECEYQFLLKVPFIDARSPVMKARAEADKEYLPYLVAQTLVQTCGRPMRAPDDRCENFIMDQHASWFLNKPEKGGYRHLVPGWFVRQIRYPTGPPQPPPPLSAGRK
jgi:Rad3-related DNA helicase